MIAARRSIVAVNHLPWIVVAEFEEQPGLRLTFPQVQRLWGLTIGECQDTLDYLIDAGMLVHGEDDRYRLADTRA
jgi:hypothetical protein